MTSPKTKPYGAWKSPITSDLIVAGTVGLGGVTIAGENIFWLEGRATEKGRTVLVKLNSSGTVTDITPEPYNVRTRVHEYGGGSYIIVQEIVYFVNFIDQRIYKILPDNPPQTLTTESSKRYADFIFDTQHNRLICVCEDHSNPNQEPENTLVSVDVKTGEVKTLTSGYDFYSSPRLSPDNSYLAWLTWNHPNLPWDGTYLWIASVNSDGSLGEPVYVAGGENESISEPKWSEDGKLYFSSDRTGWANLYSYQKGGEIEALCPMEAEFTYPHWVFGISTYTLVEKEKIICTYTQNGRWYLASLNTRTKQLEVIDTPYTDIGSLHGNKDYIVFIGGSPTQATAVVKMDLKTGKTQILKQSSEIEIDPGYISEPQAIAFPTEKGLTAYGWYYPPKNKDYIAPEGELPPLLVKSHGGPTGATSSSLNLRVQYWTSRGFAYLDVNYGGSTGYGREYRQRLDKNWGIVDVDDCVNGALHLVNEQKVDKNRLAISGGSAGGYTTLAALTFKNIFKAGASYYGVSELESLAKDTHKFESRYLERLIGKYPEEQEIYRQRSPINFIESLACPVIFFQGLEDKVVPPNQAEMMVEALKNKGLPVAYVAFPEEQHGFRRAENIKRALDGEFYFYSCIFGFEPADVIEPVEIFGVGM